MIWNLAPTKTFSQELKKFKKNKDFLDALDKKLQRLKQNPEAVGGYLSGRLHGYKATRIISKFRILFKIAISEHTVYLVAIDHRKHDYERFDVSDIYD